MNRGLSDRLSDRVESTSASEQVRRGQPHEKTNESAALQLPSQRITAGRLVTITEQLDDRDVAVLATVAKLRLVTGAQLRRLHFPDVPSADRQARRVFAKLSRLQILMPLERHIGGRRAGSRGTVFTLGVAGQRLAGGRGPAGGSRIERAWTPNILYMRHRLSISELFVRLREAESSERLEVLEFAAEPSCWRRYVGPAGMAELFKPDAFVRLGVGDQERLAFVEVDCATESPRALDRKLDRYRQYFATGEERERWGVTPLVVWLVPDNARLAVLRTVFGKQATDLRRLLQAGTFERAVEVLTGGES